MLKPQPRTAFYSGASNQHHGNDPFQPNCQATNVVITTQPSYVAQSFRETPVRTTCPNCRHHVMTSIRFQTGTVTWVVCIILCFIGCALGCCLFPFCLDYCKDVVHTCPNCHTTVGKYHKV